MNWRSSRTADLVLVEDNLDDELLSRRGIKKSDANCKLTVHRDGQAALDALLDPLAPSPTLIILDYKMPKLNGFEVLRALRAAPKTRRIPVVIFSSTSSGAALEACYHEGANSCIEKPTDPSLYVDRVKEMTHYWLEINSDSFPKGSSASLAA